MRSGPISMDLQRIFIIVLILIILGVGYYYFNFSALSKLPSANKSIVELEARFHDLRPLQSLELDTSVFDNSFFRSLRVLPPQPSTTVVPGRPNPFAPLGSVSSPKK